MAQCTSKRKDNFEISKLDFPNFLYVGETGYISLSIKNKNLLIPDKAIISLRHSGTEMYRDELWIDAKQTFETKLPFTPTTPGIHNFHLGVLDHKIFGENECEDYNEFQIKALREGESKGANELMEFWWIFVIAFVFAMVLIWRLG